MLLLPVVLLPSAESPTAVFSKATVLLKAHCHRWLCLRAAGVAPEGEAPTAVLKKPLVLLKSAAPPMAVFRLPPLQRASRNLPPYWLAVLITLERKPSNRRVVNASREA